MWCKSCVNTVLSDWLRGGKVELARYEWTTEVHNNDDNFFFFWHTISHGLLYLNCTYVV